MATARRRAAAQTLKKIGGRIRELRVERGLSQEALAFAIDGVRRGREIPAEALAERDAEVVIEKRILPRLTRKDLLDEPEDDRDTCRCFAARPSGPNPYGVRRCALGGHANLS